MSKRTMIYKGVPYEVKSVLWGALPDGALFTLASLDGDLGNENWVRRKHGVRSARLPDALHSNYLTAFFPHHYVNALVMVPHER